MATLATPVTIKAQAPQVRRAKAQALAVTANKAPAVHQFGVVGARFAPKLSISTARRTMKVRAQEEEEPQPITTADKEPDQYWKSAGEKAGKSPLEDPMAIAAISAIVVPFTILGIAIATGYIDTLAN